MLTPWIPNEVTDEAADSSVDQLIALARGHVPAYIFRQAFSPEACQALVKKLMRDGHLDDPQAPRPDKFGEREIPEGFYREGRSQQDSYAWEQAAASGRRRIDIGTSLGYRGSDPDDFFSHSKESHDLFAKLFAEFAPHPNPIRVLYDRLGSLAPDKRVMTACEPDGRQYGPAIIRAHYGGYTYAPHFDSVRLREKREGYAVHGFDHQFAGVLVLQNTTRDDRSAQCVLHNYLWQPAVDDVLRENRFHEFAQENQIGNVEVVLEPGDLYFFNTRCIHEVPGVAGTDPRIVLATFIGYSVDRDEIMVWS